MHKIDHNLWKILLVVLIVPAVVLLFIILGISGFDGVSGASSFSEDPREVYFTAHSDPENSDKILTWLNSIEEKRDLDRAYALQYTKKIDRDTYQHYFLVHAPGTYRGTRTGLQISERLFGATIQLNASWTGYNDGLYSVTMTTSKEKCNLKFVRDGKKLPCDTTPVDFNPTVYLDEPSLSYAEGDPYAGSRIIPEKMTIIQATDNGEPMGISIQIQADDDMRKLLSVIDSAPYVKLSDPIYDLIPSNDFQNFQDGYTIIIELPAQEDQEQPDTISCHAVKRNGRYYLIDDHEDKGHYIRSIDKGTYAYLESRFSSANTTPTT